VPSLTIDRAITRTFDVHPIPLTIELRVDGDTPPPATGGDRGIVQVGPEQLHVPGTGPARVQAEVLAGSVVFSVVHLCDGSLGCTAPLPRSTTLWTWLAP
jgi:hypothetical protein